MEQIPGDTTLDALYREASTRRHTAESIQADALAVETARRDASKLSARSVLMTSLMMRREVERVFEQHSLSDTGLLTRAQLQAALHSLGLLASKPPAFLSSACRMTAALPSTPSAHHSRQESAIIDTLWHLLTQRQPKCSNGSPSPMTTTVAGSHHWQPDQAAADQADSCDTLLREGFDLWQQLIKAEPSSIRAAHTAHSQMPRGGTPTPGLSTPLHVRAAESMCSTSDQPALHKQPVQRKEGIKSAMHGVSLEQLLAFVQHVQQHSRSSQAEQTAALLPAALTDRQSAELDRISRVCSQNKLANMAYVGIGNRKMQRQSLLQLKEACNRTYGTSACHAKTPSQCTDNWQPCGHTSEGRASQAVRFSRRNFRQQQQHLQQSTRQQPPAHCLQTAAAQDSRCRHRPFTSELGRQQPFARSQSTAAAMVKQRQAAAELEMLPCTFRPALDAHSLALVAAKASAYRPPQKAALPHRQPAHMPALGTHTCSVSTSGLDSSQGADTAAESARTLAAIVADASACSPTHLAVTSSDIQEERALKECTFAPRLNSNRGAKSVVAQTWKDLWVAACQREQHTAAAADRSDADWAECWSASATAAAVDDSSAADSALDGRGDECPDAGSAAVVYAGGDNSDVLCGTHKSGQNAEQESARADSKRSRLRRAHQSRQADNSYAATAQRGKKSTAAACGAVHADALSQQQHAAMYDTLASIEECAEIEAQLQAEVAGCDKRLEQCRAVRQKGPGVCRAVSNSPHGIVACVGAGHQIDSDHRSAAQLQQAALKVAIEAELADGSASRFEVQQADQLRHLTKLFAAMMELQLAPSEGEPQKVA